MTLADRATIANMCPEYGATVGYFPVDDETLNYMRNTGRPDELVSLVETYTKAQGFSALMTCLILNIRMLSIWILSTIQTEPCGTKTTTRPDNFG